MNAKFLKQIQLEEIGIQGQEKILKSKILIIGAGGLGTPACLYLSSSGIGEIGLCDGDNIELSNISRQFMFHESEIGLNKSLVLCKKIKSLNPDVKICAFDIHLTQKNAHNIIQNYDIILNCSDNLETRILIQKFAQIFSIPWVDAALSQFSGQVSYFLPNEGCYHCLFPNLKSIKNNCQTEGIIAPICGLFGSWAALTCLKIILNLMQTNVFFELNTKKNSIKQFQWQKSPTCPMCKNQKPHVNLSNDLQLAKIKKFSPQEICAVSNPVVINLSSTFANDNEIKYSMHDFFSESLDDPVFVQKNPDKNKTYILICEFGLKSKIASELLSLEGYKSLFFKYP